jgi:hypothetical protein
LKTGANFCTLFDSAYLSRGLLLYDSLKKNTACFHIYIFAFDNLTYEILQKLNLVDATIIPLKTFETVELLNIKESRSKAEYCWTCTSSVILYVLQTYKVQSCTYLDADLFFYGSPEILLNEIPEKKSILITEHRYSSLFQKYEEKRAGRFCVQFITFKNTPGCIAILKRWIDQCIDWCYSRYENGKFGDQKYLDNWPLDYPEVYVLKNVGGGVAPWNARQYDFIFKNERITGCDHRNNEHFEVVFFHFHYVRIMAEGFADLGWNWLSKNVIDGFYNPYIEKIVSKEEFLAGTFPEYKRIYSSAVHPGTKETVKHLIKSIFGYNLIKLRES